MLKKLLLLSPKWGFIGIALASSAFAQEETSVLPRGIFRTWIIGAVGGSDQHFNAGGRRQGLAHVLNRSITMRDLVKHMGNSKSPITAQSAKDLELLRNELNTVAANAGMGQLGDNLYQADIYADARVEASQLVYALEYGISRRMSIGLALPLQWYDIKADVRVENQNAFQKTINILKNTVPIEDGIKRFAAQAQDSNTFKKSIFTDNGYKIPGNTRVFGISDLEGGLKYRAYESDYVDAALLFGFRLPTASHQKDPTNLVDKATGDRQFDLAFQAGVDFKFTPNLIFYSGFKYTLQTPDQERVVGYLKGSDASLPDLNDPRVFDNSARRKLGNIWDVNLNLRYYMFQRRVALVGAYLFQHKNADRYDGSNSFLDYPRLSDNTETQSHASEIFLIYSTVADYMRQEKAIPWEASITYHHTLAGRNTPDVRYAYARLKFFFN